MNCGHYRGIKLMCHSMKLYERVHENRMINNVSISEEQFGFVKGKSTTDAILSKIAARKIQRRPARLTLCVFVDLEKSYDSVPTEELYWYMRDKGCQRSTSDR